MFGSSIYNISSFLNNPLQENLSIIILITFFWSKNILFAVGWKFHTKNNTVHY
jgi:hypothetical protein